MNDTSGDGLRDDALMTMIMMDLNDSPSIFSSWLVISCFEKAYKIIYLITLSPKLEDCRIYDVQPRHTFSFLIVTACITKTKF